MEYIELARARERKQDRYLIYAVPIVHTHITLAIHLVLSLPRYLGREADPPRLGGKVK